MRGDPLGPLHGVPVSIKDLVDVKGVPTRHGSAIFADNPPAAADDILVKRLRAAGAIVFGKATTPEFGVKGLTDGPSFGVTAIRGTSSARRAARAAAARPRSRRAWARWRSAPTARARCAGRPRARAWSG